MDDSCQWGLDYGEFVIRIDDIWGVFPARLVLERSAGRLASSLRCTTLVMGYWSLLLSTSRKVSFCGGFGELSSSERIVELISVVRGGKRGGSARWSCHVSVGQYRHPHTHPGQCRDNFWTMSATQYQSRHIIGPSPTTALMDVRSCGHVSH